MSKLPIVAIGPSSARPPSSPLERYNEYKRRWEHTQQFLLRTPPPAFNLVPVPPYPLFCCSFLFRTAFCTNSLPPLFLPRSPFAGAAEQPQPTNQSTFLTLPKGGGRVCRWGGGKEDHLGVGVGGRGNKEKSFPFWPSVARRWIRFLTLKGWRAGGVQDDLVSYFVFNQKAAFEYN